ncbi:MAG TPA: Crp/Fnr family transcriptional regulator [Burkholderiaceae bacterium]|nr:Crp/Fnr family transcriptional regulator [Burkholderiaceae bacterium]
MQLSVPKKTVADALRGSPWGPLLSADELNEVATETTERHVALGGFVARTGQPVEHWTGVIEGVLKMSVTSHAGKVTTLAGINRGGWFGEGSLIKREPRRYDVVALRAARIAMVPYAAFQRLRETNLAFNHYLQGLMNARLSLFIGLLECGRLLDTDARVARCLASLFNPDLYPEPRPYLDLCQHEIGLLAGVSRQRANVALHTLEERGLLRVEPRGLTVLDLEGLRSFAGTP